MESISHYFGFRMIKFILLDLLGDTLRVPVWWYTKGLARASRGLWSAWIEMERRTALFVWIRSLFVPMYGLHDWQSRLISFVMRLVLLVWKIFFMGVWSIILLCLLVGWVLVPVVAVVGIIR